MTQKIIIFNSMNSYVNSLMILLKNTNNKKEWYFEKICKFLNESVDEHNWIYRWIQMNSLRNSIEFIEES